MECASRRDTAFRATPAAPLSREGPERRLHDIADAGAEPFEAAAPSIIHRRPSRLPWVLLALASAVGVVALVALAQAWTRSDSRAALPSLFRFDQKTFDQEVMYNARFMPDGQSIVYSAARTGNRPEVFLLLSGSMIPRSIAPTGTHLLSVSSSGELAVLTDTTYLNFHRIHEGTLARMTIDGSPRALVEDVRDADWGPDGELAIVRRQSGMDRLEYPSGKLLYETTGYVSEPRVSADGSRVAFLDHPKAFDDRGWVKVVDQEGKLETLAGEFLLVEGLAWNPGGERLLISGVEEGSARNQPMSVGVADLDTRAEATTPGDFLIVDVDPDGRWLAISVETILGVAVRRPRGESDTDLSWLDQSWGASLSPDGETIVFTDGHGGANDSVVTRRVDGSPIMVLGPGDALGFSPDGRWVAARLYSPQGIVLYPAGAGEARRLEPGPIETYASATYRYASNA